MYRIFPMQVDPTKLLPSTSYTKYKYTCCVRSRSRSRKSKGFAAAATFRRPARLHPVRQEQKCSGEGTSALDFDSHIKREGTRGGYARSHTYAEYCTHAQKTTRPAKNRTASGFRHKAPKKKSDTLAENVYWKTLRTKDATTGFLSATPPRTKQPTTGENKRTWSLRSELKSSFFFLGSLPGSGLRVTNSWIYVMRGLRASERKRTSGRRVVFNIQYHHHEDTFKLGEKARSRLEAKKSALSCVWCSNKTMDDATQGPFRVLEAKLQCARVIPSRIRQDGQTRTPET